MKYDTRIKINDELIHYDYNSAMPLEQAKLYYKNAEYIATTSIYYVNGIEYTSKIPLHYFRKNETH